MHRNRLIWVPVGVAKRRTPFLLAALGQRARLCSWTHAKTLQLEVSRCHFLPFILRVELWWGVSWGEVTGLPEKEELRPGYCLLHGLSSSSASDPGAALQSSSILSGYSAWKPEEPCLPRSSSQGPRRKEAGIGGAQGMCMCVYLGVCMRASTHACGCPWPWVDMELKTRECNMVRTTRALSVSCCWDGV